MTNDNSKTIKELTGDMNAFVKAMGWYRPDSEFEQSPRNIAISISLEAAEILEHFQWGENADAEALAEELADVALYLLQLAYLMDLDLSEAIKDKLERNYRRFGRSRLDPIEPVGQTRATSGPDTERKRE